MKKLFALLLIFSLLNAKKIVVDGDYVCIFIFCTSTCVEGDYKTDTIEDALNNANNGDEIVICPYDSGYNESNLNINNTDLYIHSYGDDPSKVKVYDDSGNPIFNVQKTGVTLKGLTVEQDSDNEDAIYVDTTDIDLEDLNISSKGKGIHFKQNLQNSIFNDVNITSSDESLYFEGSVDNTGFEKMEIDSSDKGFYIAGDNQDNNFSELNITSSGRCIDAVGAVFKNVIIENSEFNQTSSGEYAFVTYANPFEDNNFSDINISSSDGYGLYFASGLKDSNFTRFDGNSSDDFFVVNAGDMNNIRFNDINFSSDNGRAVSISDGNGGNLINSYFNDVNLSSNWESLYVDTDILNTTFNNFIISGSTAFYGNNYIKNSVFENGEINASSKGIYSSKEFNQSKIDNVKITADKYGLYFSENSDSGTVNDENNFTNLTIVQTSDSSSSYSGIRFKKKVNNSVFDDINISAAERGVWLSTGGENNTFSNSEFNSSENIGFRNSNLLQNNSFSNINIYSYKDGLSFYGDVKNNNFDNFYIESNTSDGIYGTTNIDISSNNFTNFTIKADDYGVYFKDSTSDNNFTNFYSRVNKYSFKFAKYSTNDYFLHMDLNGTKGIEFNISKSDVVEDANITTTQNEPLYFKTIESAVNVYDLNFTSTKDNCIYVETLDDDLNVSVKNFTRNELNCSDYNGIQISNDSTASVNVRNSNFIFNADSSDTSRALIKSKNLKTLNLADSVLDGADKRRGIYVDGSVDNIYITNTSISNTDDSGVYLKRVNNVFYIEDSNFSSSSSYGIYIGAIGSSFSKGEIKRNYFKNNSDYAVDIFNNNSTDTDKIEVWTNCFYNNNSGGNSQAYTYDSSAKYDDGSEGNYWDDLGSNDDKYQIDPSSINLYDNYPLNECPLEAHESNLMDIRDVFRDYNDTNISTKTVNKDFNLTVASYDENKSNLQDFNGTVCVQIIDDNDKNLTPWKKMDDFLNDVNESNWTNIKIDSARSKVKVIVQWKRNSDDDCPLSGDYNETNSSDEFALRPYKFAVTNIPSKIRAGEDFNITVQALDYEGNPTKDYNGTAVNIDGDTVDLEYNISKSGCLNGNLTKQSDENFSNGEVNVTLKYDEVGELNLTLKEVNGSEFSKVDNDDTDEAGRFIEENRTTITVVPYKFEINASVKNFDNSFTYLDNNLSIYSLLEINISAESKDGNITKNYNKECYAKNIEINISKELNPSPDLNNVLYFYRDVNDSNSSVISQDINSDIEINYSDTNFTTDNNGSTAITLFINFDRNSSKSVSPFEMNVSEINVSDGDANGTKDNIGKSLYYYGDFILFDEETNESNFTTKDEYFVIYNQNGGDGNGTDEILPDWYLNSYHNAIDGNISNANIIVSSDYNASNTISDVNVTVNTLSNGTVTFDVNRSGNSRKFAVIHLLEPNLKWIWYSKFGNEYNISTDSTCLNHFCFSVNWQTESGENQVVSSGEVNGTEANVTTGNTRRRGTKIFR